MTDSPLPIKLPDLPASLRELLYQIPHGRVTTYGTLAEALGNVVASRWVGLYMLDHQHDEACPCHRVVRAAGYLGKFITGSVVDKARRLVDEGIELISDRVDLTRYGFDGFHSERPLQRLANLQMLLRRQVSLETVPGAIRRVAGVDVSYTQDGRGVAAYAMFDAASKELAWHMTAVRNIKFPYITSYLAFRELPLLVDLVHAARMSNQQADVLIVDGSGVLHPRRCGIASMLGVLCHTATIGLTKKLLCGTYDPDELEDHRIANVTVNDELLGQAYLPPSGSQRPLFVCPGHRLDVDRATEILLDHLGSRRLPSPIYWADRISREVARSID